MGKKIDLTGQRFGRLVVIEDSGERKSNNVIWICKCDCGNECMRNTRYIQEGFTRSCGCLYNEMTSKMGTEENHLNNHIEKDTVEIGTRLTSLNQSLKKNNTSGHKGVYFHKKNKKWIAEIWLKRKKKHLGSFDNIQDAINARKEAEEKYFKPILEKYGKEIKEN